MNTIISAVRVMGLVFGYEPHFYVVRRRRLSNRLHRMFQMDAIAASLESLSRRLRK